MKRALAILTLVLVATLAPVGVASAASTRCAVSITPATGSPTDVYRIAVAGVPVDLNGGSVEVRLDIRLLGTRSGSIYFVFVVPGATEFYVDHNESLEGEPSEGLAPGRYLVQVTTPHIHGACSTVGRFTVRPI